jgi:hypothetical protein
MSVFARRMQLMRWKRLNTWNDLMSLMRLLTAGKSWVGQKDSEFGYRLTDPRSMPKFEAKKNPFRTKANEPPEQQAAATATEASVEREAVFEAGPVAVETKHEFADEAAVVLTEEVVPAVEPTSQEISMEAESGLCEPQRPEESIGLVVSDSLRSEDTLRLPESQAEAGDEVKKNARVKRAFVAAATRVGGWFRSIKFRAAKILEPVTRRMPKRAHAEAERRAIQTELSLDSIKVVRNDFREGDFELVAAVPRRVRPRSSGRLEGRAAKDEQPMLMSEAPQEAAQQTAASAQ